MKFKKTRFKGLIIYDGKNFKDKRGFFREVFKKKKLKEICRFYVYLVQKKMFLGACTHKLKTPKENI